MVITKMHEKSQFFTFARVFPLNTNMLDIKILETHSSGKRPTTLLISEVLSLKPNLVASHFLLQKK